MIQRIQSVYLLCIVLLAVIMLASNCTLADGKSELAGVQISCNVSTQTILGLSSTGISQLNIVSIIGFSLIALFSAICIFLYKNLPKQLKFIGFNYFVIIVSICAIYYPVARAGRAFESVFQIHYSPWLFLTLLTLILNFLAHRGIKRDIDLIGSADRLR